MTTLIDEENVDDVVGTFNRYRKQPVVVEAVELEETIAVETREGTIVGEPGDYLIRGVDGEIYPCDPAIFDQTYDRVEP
jgi:hypothetical protein